MAETDDFFNHESLLIITNEGVLKRLKTPFRALLIVSITDLEKDQIYLVNAVISNMDNILMYGVKGYSYYYYYFIIIG